jgi:geranylgeranylglycerol-phosphate geranylgeranyltransferase
MISVVRILRTQLPAVMELLRPYTLLAPIIVSSSVIIASFFYNQQTTFTFTHYILIVLPASISFALLNGASNTLNQATDYREDAISKPYRPIPRGIISRSRAYSIAAVFYLTAILLTLFIHTTFTLIISLIAFFSITYSIHPRMKKYLFLNQIWVAIPRGFLGILGSWSIFGNPLDQLPLTIGTIAALFLIGGTSTKDILDASADQTAGTHTLVNVFGITKATKISALFMISSFIIIIPLVYLKILDWYFIFLSTLIICSIGIAYRMIHTTCRHRYENTSAWTLMYSTYFLFALSFAFLVISFS